jgi:hypothetical protein
MGPPVPAPDTARARAVPVATARQGRAGPAPARRPGRAVLDPVDVLPLRIAEVALVILHGKPPALPRRATWPDQPCRTERPRHRLHLARARRRHHRQVRGGHQRTLRPGTKVLLRARADYDIHFGFSLTVEDIDPADAGHRATCISKRGPSWYWAGSAPDWLTVDEPVRSGSPWFTMFQGRGLPRLFASPSSRCPTPRGQRAGSRCSRGPPRRAPSGSQCSKSRGVLPWCFTMLQDELLHLGK